MNKSVNPAVIAVVVVLAVGMLGYFFYKSMQPAYYLPSPGVGGRPATGVPSYAKAPGAPQAMTPAVPPADSRPGDPRSLKH
jgi:hypothetical protein